MSADGSFFRARRTDARGEYVFDTMPEGHYALGVSAEDFEYREVTVTTSVAPAAEFILGPDANRGRWSVLGNTDPEHFGRTNSGVLLPTGRIIYCHDTF